MNDVVVVRDLVKTYGRTRALDGLDLTVRRGEVHGFLGPNGAGKTTTLRILLGLLRPDSGHAEVLGRHPVADAVTLHRLLAYVPGDVELWPNLTGGEVVDVLTRLRGGADPARVTALAERFDLDLRKKGRAYSKGNRQKVALVAALAVDVELLVLDEPTSGLDPLMEAVFQDEVRRAADRGVTVLLSSHVLAQVEALADRVSVVRQGRNVETGSLTELRHLSRTSVEASTDRAPDALATSPGVHGFAVADGVVRFEIDGEHLDGAVRELSSLGLRSLVAHPPTLEQLLLRYYGDDAATATTEAVR